jgi:hypothetical protein
MDDLCIAEPRGIVRIVDSRGLTDPEIVNRAHMAYASMDMSQRAIVSATVDCILCVTEAQINGGGLVSVTDPVTKSTFLCPCTTLTPRQLVKTGESPRVWESDAPKFEAVFKAIIRNRFRDRGLEVEVALCNKMMSGWSIGTGALSLRIYNTGQRYAMRPVLIADESANKLQYTGPPFLPLTPVEIPSTRPPLVIVAARPPAAPTTAAAAVDRMALGIRDVPKPPPVSDPGAPNPPPVTESGAPNPPPVSEPDAPNSKDASDE